MTAKSDRIERLVKDPDLKQAFDDVRQALLQAFATTPPNDGDKMKDIRKRLHLLDSVEANLHRAIQDGKLEDFRVAEKERPPFLGDLSKWRKNRA